MPEQSAPISAKPDSSADAQRIIEASSFKFSFVEWNEIRRMLYCAWDSGYTARLLDESAIIRQETGKAG